MNTHPTTRHLPARRFDDTQPIEPVSIPTDVNEATLNIAGRDVRLTNLDKPFWPDLGIAKRDLLQYYSDVSPLLLPHIHDRTMVMKRYPNGASGEFFFMKRTPTPRPDWLETCSIVHNPTNTIEFPVIQDLPSLLWLINLGCIDLNQWYARTDDVDKPDYIHFDLDPGAGVEFAQVRQSALIVRQALTALGFPVLAKTSGSKGMHLYVPIVRGPMQHPVWAFAKKFAHDLAAKHPDLLTAQMKIADRPAGRVLVDYNQNAWGRTLASVYSVRPTPTATVSTPVTWDEIEAGVQSSDFTIGNVRERFASVGDLWRPLLEEAGRVDLGL